MSPLRLYNGLNGLIQYNDFFTASEVFLVGAKNVLREVPTRRQTNLELCPLTNEIIYVLRKALIFKQFGIDNKTIFDTVLGDTVVKLTTYKTMATLWLNNEIVQPLLGWENGKHTLQSGNLNGYQWSAQAFPEDIWTSLITPSGAIWFAHGSTRQKLISKDGYTKLTWDGRMRFPLTVIRSAP